MKLTLTLESLPEPLRETNMLPEYKWELREGGTVLRRGGKSCLYTINQMLADALWACKVSDRLTSGMKKEKKMKGRI